MSKKTREKSSGKTLKKASGKAARAKSNASAKTRAAKSPGKTAAGSGKKTGKPAATPRPKSADKPASKSLRSSPPKTATGRPAAESKTAAGTPDTRVLTVGARAPAFRLPRDGGDAVSLEDFSDRRLVLFFYPRADTPGCTREAIDFTRLASAFAENQTAILGVSADPPKAQEAFRDKHQLLMPLASDEAHGMIEAYGAWGEKSMYGRTFQGILRTTVLIGEDGRIMRIWRNVKVDGHADDVLAAVRAL
ncbi:MAG: redoxin domain-containing protein [Bradyrhizobium sp.]